MALIKSYCTVTIVSNKLNRDEKFMCCFIFLWNKFRDVSPRLYKHAPGKYVHPLGKEISRPKKESWGNFFVPEAILSELLHVA